MCIDDGDDSEGGDDDGEDDDDPSDLSHGCFFFSRLFAGWVPYDLLRSAGDKFPELDSSCSYISCTAAQNDGLGCR